MANSKNYSDPGFRPTTLVDLLRWRAVTMPDQRAFTYLLDGNKKELVLTYSDLDRKARAFAAMLQKKGMAGERALLLYPPGIDYIIAFFGCLYAGVIAVPAYPPDPNRLNRTLPRLQAIVKDAQSIAALTNDTIMYMIKILKLGSKFSDTMERMPVLRKFRTTMNYFSKQTTGIAEAQDLGTLMWISSDDVVDSLADSWKEPDINSDTIAFLQYTSGSTGTPKGVMLTHENLLINSAHIYSSFGYSKNTEGVIWLPIYHDMGLIGGILQPIYGGMPTTLLSPVHFLQRPMRWLEAISRIKDREIVSGGPNFAYDLCVKKVTEKQLQSLDLSNWKVAFSGAEPVRQETLDRFYNTFKNNGFEKSRFLSCYGLAEATLFVTGVDTNIEPPALHLNGKDLQKGFAVEVEEAHPKAKHMVSCGHAPQDQVVAIVNPETLERVKGNETGEIWVMGPNVAKGYWNREDATKETFQAYISETNEGPFLRTGDLGYIKEGQLYITGRVKDLIIIRGRNYYPQDIEFITENAHPSVRPGCSAAFSVEQNSEEKLVVVCEVRQTKNLPFEEIVATIRQTITETNDIRVQDIVLIKPRSINKTSSGKIQRHAVKNDYENGELKTVYEWHGGESISEASLVEDQWDAEADIEDIVTPDSEAVVETDIVEPGAKSATALEVEKWLIENLAESLDVDKKEIDIRKPFVSYGLDSAQAIGMVGDLEEHIGRPLSPTIIWDYPNIESLAQYIQSEGTLKPTKTKSTRKAAGNEPIAIVGYSLRMPQARNAEEFWNNLVEGKDCISEVPKTRWDVDEFYDPTPGKAAKMITRWGGFMDDVDQFDPQFFGISPREAPHMDPQQRLLLEVSYEALENAGLNMQSVAGSETGVFVAISGNDYLRLQIGDFKRLDAYSGTGNAFSIAANRLSYIYDFKGPSFIIDTACSSSLVAVHNAVNSLRSGECEMAMAGGVNLILAPDVTITFSQAMMMSPDGRCKTFDADANGYVRGDGVGVVILKRLSDAIKDGDSIRAVIRGSAINQDGRSNGITAPNGLMQKACIQAALDNAEANPADVGYFETHGTGTPLGDPIETEAMRAVMVEGREKGNPLIIGSVKTNIGHLESAAGISGLLKTVMILEKGIIPKHLHFKKLNPHIKLDEDYIRIARENVPWPASDKPRLAGVSAYGFGGTNAHIVLEEAPRAIAVEREPTQTVSRAQILIMSAHSEEALQEMAKSYYDALSNTEFADSNAYLDFLYSAAIHRAQQDFSAGIVAASREDLLEKLEHFDGEQSLAGTVKDSAETNAAAKTVFVFSGQGPQWYAMGRQLYQEEPIYKQTIDQIDRMLQEHAEWSLVEELNRPEESSRVSETAIAQPAIFALQVALARLWESWGVRPAAVVGHSVGEVAAAHISGMLTLKDAVKVIYHRGRLMQGATGLGKMASLDLPLEEAQKAIEPYSGKVGIAAHNSPENTVISGEEEAIKELVTQLESKGVYCKIMRVNYAFHSPQMEPFKKELAEVLEGVKPYKARLAIYSTLSGKQAKDDDYDPQYWSDNIRQAVSFAEAIDAIVHDGYTQFLEIAPHPVLAGSIKQCLRAQRKSGLVVSSLRRKEDERAAMLLAAASLYCRGHKVYFKKVFPAHCHFRPLPAYPWQHKRYWFELKGNDPRNAPIFRRSSLQNENGHPLIGASKEAPLSPGKRFYESTLEIDRLAYLKDHKIQDAIVFPATGYVEMALASAGTNNTGVELTDFNFFRALFLSEEKDTPVQVILTPKTNRSSTIQIFSKDGAAEENADQPWQMNSMGSLRLLAENENNQHATAFKEIKKRCSKSIDVNAFFDKMSGRGLQYGPSFKGARAIWKGDGEAFAEIGLNEALKEELDSYHLHPALLDSCMQVLSAAIDDEAFDNDDSTFMPVAISRLRVFQKATDKVWCHAAFDKSHNGADSIAGHITLYGEDGSMLAELESLKLQRLGQQQKENISDAFYRVEWRKKELPTSAIEHSKEGSTWLLFAPKHNLGKNLAARLEQYKQNVITVRMGEDFSRLTDNLYSVAADTAEHYEALFEKLKEENRQPAHILYMWPLDITSNTELDPARLTESRNDVLLPALYMLQALLKKTFSVPPKLTVLTANAIALENDNQTSLLGSALWGLGRVVSSENPKRKAFKVDIDDLDNSEELILAECSAEKHEDQIVYRNGKRYCARLARAKDALQIEEEGVSKEIPDGPYALKPTQPGVLSGLKYEPCPRGEVAAGQVEIENHAAGLNFRDVLMALGLYPGGPIPLGSECSGTISKVGEEVTGLKKGDPVMAIAPHTFGRYSVTSASLVVKKPQNISFTEAATIPITYLTAWYALVYLGRMRKGERVLIHAGAGGVGQAAIRIAQMTGAEIFTTAGSEEKHAFLREMGVKNIFNSRTLDFADEIMDMTDGEGVDLVLNSLAGEFIPRSMALLRPYGRFLEIGKTDLFQNSQLDMYPFRNNLSYHAIDLDMVSRDKPQLIHELFEEVMECLANEKLQPLPFKEFSATGVLDAFRYMAQRRNIGKIVVNMRPADDADSATASTGFAKTDASYLVTGGLGNIGLSVSKWLASQGAGTLVLLSRNKKAHEDNEIISAIKQNGCKVELRQADVGDLDSLKSVFKEFGSSLPELRGIIHCAGTLNDAGLLHQTREIFEQPLAAKIDGSFNLHQLSQNAELDFFVLFSSVAAVTGNPGQANYASANIFMDALAATRRQQGLKATSINWGFWAGTTMAEGSQIRVPGAGAITVENGLKVLESVLTQNKSDIVVSPVAWNKFLSPYREDSIPPLFEDFAHLRGSRKETAGDDALSQEVLLPLANEERIEMMTDYLRKKIAGVVGVAESKLETNKSLSSMGLDSLMAIEVKNSVENSLGTQLPIAALLKGPTIEEIAEDMLGQIMEAQQDGDAASAEVIPENALSHGQQAMWFQHQLNPTSIYNQVYAVKLLKPIDVEQLQDALDKLARRHPALRTNFVTDNGMPVQMVHQEPQKIFYEVDARHMDEDEFQKIFKGETKRTFDLEKDPLTHITLFHMADGTQIFLYVAHHIVSDMWSLAIFIKELNDFYTDGEETSIEPLSYTYSDYVRDSRRMLAGKYGKNMFEFWKNELTGELPVLNLPTDNPRPSVQTYNGLTETISFDAETTAKLQHLAEQNEATLYALLLSIFKVLLYRYTQQEDIVIGTPTTGRTDPNYAPLLGYFVNPAAVRSTIKGEKPFDTYLAEMSEKVVNILDNQAYPFNLLVEKLNIRRDPSRTPIFQVMFVYQKAYLLHETGMSGLAVEEEGGHMTLGDVELESISIPDRVVPFDLTMLMAESEGSLGASLQYNTDLFRKETALKILRHYKMLVQAILENPAQPIQNLRLLDDQEREKVVTQWNDTSNDADISLPVPRRFEEMAARYADKEAIVFGEESLTYSELNSRANQLARVIKSHGISADQLVGISLPRSMDTIVAILAVLKAGAGYLPLDPDYPAQRLNFMLSDSDCSMLLTGSTSKGQFGDTAELPILCLDKIADVIAQEDDSNLEQPLSAQNLVYVIYTSGSTGRPKGVMLSHGGLNNLVNAQVKEFRINEETRLLQFASLSFDAAASEIFTTLLSGATLVMSESETLRSGPDLQRYIKDKGVSTATIPPSVLRVLQPDGFEGLQNLISAGESLGPDVASKWSGGRHMVNAYGPTETTICVSCYHVEEEKLNGKSVPIGKPIENVKAYILDKYMNPVPPGIPGELYVAGDGIARGYLRRPALTAEKFVPDPFSGESGARLYRTGDLARWLEDGNLEFIDRIDQQVKIRGFRIELGEIESLLKEEQNVKDCIVVARGKGDKRLAAYLILENKAELDVENLKYNLHKRLPEYMVPAHFMAMEKFPLTSNGKIDIAALPAPEADKSTFVQAGTETERKLVEIWQEVLNLEQVGTNDNFFELGGHSLNIVQAQSKIKDIFDKEINVVDMFRYPTIGAFAKFLSNGSDAKATVEESEKRAGKQREATRLAQKRMRNRRR